MSSYNDDIFNQSDDDIFNDDSHDDTAKATQYLADHIKEAHGITIDASDFTSDDKPQLVRSKMYISLAEASSNWVGHSNTASFTRATQHAIDEITNGRYSKLYYLYMLESKIIQRKIVLQFLNMLSETDDVDFEQIKKVINLHIDDIYITSFIGTFAKVVNHIVNSQIEIYLALAKDLGIAPTKDIQDMTELVDLSMLQKKFIQDSFNTYITEEYLHEIISRISSEQS